MNRSDITKKLAEQYPQFTAKDIELAVKCIFDSMTGTLAKGGRIEMRDFGTFCLNYKPPRKGRNPKTGEAVMVPAKYVPHFKMGKELRERVDSK
jgi:integration host factor subunit beta